ncbi:hypothetical protein IWW38_000155 [Coemansia aciculifera]|uniref:Uncharacterized protein n=1 Tax=Coemansia aciculifera TaxID=417176 RepID=A0ACC1MAS8_9FUNG|nr:hypothetical protein IWW38_000155 [Coemansia aciculifera]
MDNQHLFVKEGGDFAYQRGMAAATAAEGGAEEGFRVSVYRHAESNLRIVLCRIPRPLYSLNIYVPTVSPNDKGLPHTLEHLIFCGSQRYPSRGYLDALANCNLSTGTNAWTSDDHTCYTLSTASEEALANVLPVYLDHVLHPLLKDEQFVTEVYHYDTTGKEQGVVFSEMVARENGENDLLGINLDRLMFAPNSPYTFMSGGQTAAIAQLTNAEIIEYHRKYYDANNITVVITGAISDDFVNVLQSLPRDIVQSAGQSSRTPIDCSLPPADQPRFKHVPFPSVDTDTGSIGFGWRGPPSSDAETVIAIEMLLDYLADNSSSPLNQRFVERTSPLASDVAAEVTGTVPSTVILHFSGVPHPSSDDTETENSEDEESDNEQEDDDDEAEAEDPDIPHLFEEGYFERLLISELQRIYDSRFDGDDLAMQKLAERFRHRLAEDMENKPDDLIQEMLCIDIVNAHFSSRSQESSFSIGSRANIFDIVDQLARKPAAFWLGVLKTWLIDAPVHYVAMTPSATLGPQLESERKKVERQNEASIVDKLEHAKNIARAIETSKVNIPGDIQRKIPMPDLTKVASMPHSQRLDKLTKAIGPVSAVQLIWVESEFPEVVLHIPLHETPDHLRPFMVLFQELLLSSDLMLPAGVFYDTEETPTAEERRIGYKTVVERLAAVTTSSDSSIGFGNSSFSCSWLEDIFMLSISFPQDKLKLAVRWLVQAFMFADFTAERILTVAQNLLSELSDWKRDGDSVAMSVVTYFTAEERTNQPRWMDKCISIFEQESVLKHVVDKVRAGDISGIVEKLNAIQGLLIGGSGGFLTLGMPANGDAQSYLADYTREWDANIGKRGCESQATQLDEAKSPFPLERSTRFPELSKPRQMHIPMPSLQASCVQIAFKCNLYRAPSSDRDFDEELGELPALDYYALSMLTNLLHRVDGPLYNTIRGKGYAYSTYFVQCVWVDMVMFICSSAADAPKAILEMRRLMADLDASWDDYVSDFEINMTRSSMVFENTASQATPHDMMASCVTSNIFGFESAAQSNRWRNAHLSALKKSDLRRVYDLYLRRFADPEYPTFTVVLTPPDTVLPDELGDFECRALESLFVPYEC